MPDWIAIQTNCGDVTCSCVLVFNYRATSINDMAPSTAYSFYTFPSTHLITRYLWMKNANWSITSEGIKWASKSVSCEIYKQIKWINIFKSIYYDRIVAFLPFLRLRMYKYCFFQRKNIRITLSAFTWGPIMELSNAFDIRHQHSIFAFVSSHRTPKWENASYGNNDLHPCTHTSMSTFSAMFDVEDSCIENLSVLSFWFSIELCFSLLSPSSNSL